MFNSIKHFFRKLTGNHRNNITKNMIFYTNAGGLPSKMPNILTILDYYNPAIICISETHITDEIIEAEFRLSGFSVVNCGSHSRHTGGVAIYIRDGIQYQELLQESFENNVWIIAVKIQLNKTSYVLCNIYHSPSSSDAQFISFLEEKFEELLLQNCAIIIVGDFNIDLKTVSTYSKKIIDLFEFFGLNQLITEYTRVTQYSATLIDYLVTNDENVLKHEVTDYFKISDHSNVLVHMPIKWNYNRKSPKIMKRYFKYFNKLEFQFTVLDSNWDSDSTDVNRLAEDFINILVRALDIHSPFKEIGSFGSFKVKVWFSEDLMNEIKNRDILFKIAKKSNKEEDWNHYKLIRNRVTTKIRKETRQHYEQKIDQSRGDPKTMWKNLKELINGKSIRMPNSIKFEEGVKSSDEEIANSFNYYFINSIKNSVESIRPSEDKQKIVEQISFHGQEFIQFKKISIGELNKIIKSITKNNSDKHGINLNILKLTNEIVGNHLLNIINTSLDKGEFPESWKVSSVVPVQKVANTTNCAEFRPVNTLPVYEKVLELVVKEQLTQHINQNDIIVKEQSGFRKEHSCEAALQFIISQWRHEIYNNKKIIISVFLDLKRAFETINIDLLVMKLEAYGIKGNVLKWFNGYLKNRRQYVKYNHKLSDTLDVTFGVPQGSALGPTLFLIFINDIVKQIKNSGIKLFADDTMIYIVGEANDIKQMIEDLHFDLKNVTKWFKNNGLILNTGKTKFMTIGSKHNLGKLKVGNTDYKIEINGELIQKVEQIKYLGFIIDDELNFNAHCQYVKKKMAKKIGFLFRLSNKVSMFARLTIYKITIAPHLDYCGTFIYFMNQKQINMLQKIQNRAMRAILLCKKRTPIKIMLETLDFLNVSQRAAFNVLKFIFRLKRGTLPTYLTNGIKYIHDIHCLNTRARSMNNFYIDYANAASKTVFTEGLILFNSLPREIKDSINMERFKQLCLNFVKTNVK